jgi:hypothetical protein
MRKIRGAYNHLFFMKPKTSVVAMALGRWRCYTSLEAHATSLQHGLTRLQREAETLVALDVEYAVVIDAKRQRLQLPAEVCLIDANSTVLIRSFCDASKEMLQHPGARGANDWEFRGGVHPDMWIGATPLAAIQDELKETVEGRPVVGHNLTKDLVALGLDSSVPTALRRDTMRYACLQSDKGFGRSLAELARIKLGRVIQKRGQRHDPYEDAVAALDLYLQCVHYNRDVMGYEDLVQLYAQQLLAQSTLPE